LHNYRKRSNNIDIMEKKLPLQCPSCQARLQVKKLTCSSCGTEVDGLFDFPVLAGFNGDEQEFLLHFIKTGGSLKEMAAIMDRSYPFVRNCLDEIIQKVKQTEKSKNK
jgi:hypothetical protein